MMKYNQDTSRKLFHNIVELLCALLVLCTFWQYTFQGKMILFYGKIGLSVLMWAYNLLYYPFSKKEFSVFGPFIMYVVLFSVIGNGSYQVALTYFGIAYYFLRKEQLSPVVWGTVSVIISLQVIFAWINSVNSYYLFYSMSRNYVSVFLLFTVGLFYICLEKKRVSFPIVLSVILWLFSISAIGRGGIIASSIMLMLFFAKWLFNKDRYDNSGYLLKQIFVFILFLVLIIYISNNLEHIERTYFGRFFGTEASADDSTAYRKSIYTNYIQTCFNSLKMLLFGSDPSKFTVVVSNLHNSYLQIHSQFGLFGVLFVVVGAIKSYRFLYVKKMFDSMIILTGVLVRAATDWCFPAFPLEIILLYFLFLPHISVSKHSESSSATLT